MTHPPQIRIELTGLVERRRTVVRFDEQSVLFTNACLRVFVDLAHARCMAPDGTGSTKLPSVPDDAGENGRHQIVHRLRVELERALAPRLGVGIGARLIDNGRTGTYRLCVPASDLDFHASFWELGDVIAPNVMADLRRLGSASSHHS
jgi:hypothetical protein